MKTLAALLVKLNEPLVLDQIEIPQLKEGQVLVEVKYSGVCHTQLLEVRGKRGEDPYLPHCLGHEGSGIVRQIGDKVEKVKEGDHVILSWIKGSGKNAMGTIYQWNGQKVNAGAITTFSHYAIISENRLTPIPKTFPLKEAALLGCALPTGLGVIFNTAAPKSGQNIAIFGCGGVGLCAIQGAKIAGCVPIIAVDTLSQKESVARKMGATHFINPTKEDVVAKIRSICDLDFAIEATGSPIAMNQALESVRPQGGCAVIVGNAHHGKTVTIDPKQFNLGKKILGTWGGDNQPDLHFPRYCQLYNYGLLDLSSLTSKCYSISKIDDALNDLEQGLTLRPMVDMAL